MVDRILWLCLSLVLNACSLVADFPDGYDAGDVTGKTGDAGVSRDAGCKDPSKCAVCAPGCTTDQAPICGSKGCECEPGQGPCKAGVCDPEKRKCVPCLNSLHCAGATNGFDTCVDNTCVDCARNNPNDPSDDEGCTDVARPVCSAQGTCVGCTPGGKDCPSGQTCVAGNGCFGCNPQPGFPDNNCKAATPACLPVADGATFQCTGCTDNTQCKDAFCDEPHGTCHSACDPHPATPTSGNGCKADAPICKAGADGTYSCVPCTASDMCPTGQVCSLAAPTAGQCVAPGAACMPGMTLVNGACVAACTTNAQCASNAAGPLCINGMCGRCPAGPAGDAACAAASPAAPFCSAAGACVACKVNADCKAPLAPFCSAAGACVGCLAAGGTAAGANAQCDTLTRGRSPVCVTNGPFAGGCGVCNPGATATESTCRFGRSAGYCFSAAPNTAPVCNGCVNDLPITQEICTPVIDRCALVNDDVPHFECVNLLGSRGN